MRIKWLFFVLFVFQAEQVSTFGHTLDEWLWMNDLTNFLFIASLTLLYYSIVWNISSMKVASFLALSTYMDLPTFYYNLINYSMLFAYVEKGLGSDANKTG